MSHGARAVSLFASLRPERVDRIALLSPVGVLPHKRSFLAAFRLGGGDFNGRRPWLGRASLRRIAAPVLLLVGERDRRLGRNAMLNAARRALPNLVLAAIVPEAGHALHRDQPTAVSGVLADFLLHGDDWHLLPQSTHSARAL
jgi:pimeloyl-ACP methyl ester carboxylesterase